MSQSVLILLINRQVLLVCLLILEVWFWFVIKFVNNKHPLNKINLGIEFRCTMTI